MKKRFVLLFLLVGSLLMAASKDPDLKISKYAAVFGSNRLVKENEISSLLNVNREILNSNIALLMALKEFYLDAEQAKAIGLLPGVS